jgi:hypothetical protein
MSEREKVDARAVLVMAYEHARFRRSRLHSDGNTTRAMELMCNDFETEFGPVGAHVIAMGDWGRGWMHTRDGKRRIEGMV